jgi:hypothetical protein
MNGPPLADLGEGLERRPPQRSEALRAEKEPSPTLGGLPSRRLLSSYQPNPGGTVDSPSSFSPQQAASPFALTPQVWLPPALTALKLPAGGVD